MSFYVGTKDEDLSKCSRGCPEPVHRRFIGKAYCWDCWCDLRDELEDREPEYEPEEDD